MDLSSRKSSIIRRLHNIASCLALSALVGWAVSARAVEIPPPGDPFFIQTNSSDAAIGLGDWYTSSANGVGGGFHYVGIYVPCSWPASEDLHIDIFSPEMNTNNLPLDEPNGSGRGTTTFELYDAGTAVVSPATPAPGAAGSISSLDFPVLSTPEQWVRAFTLPAPVQCGEYVLRSESRQDDQNSWRLRVGLDNDADPNNPFPANWDDPDLVPGSDDELLVGLYQYSFQQDTGGVQCNTLYEFVPEGEPSIMFNNFDMDGNTRVTYYPPLSPVDPNGLIGGIAGTVSGGTTWNNNGTQTTRDGDIIDNPDAGWWAIVSCLSSNNQLAQDGQEDVPQFNQIPPIPVIELIKDDQVVAAAPGDPLTYSISFENISDDDLKPGAARNLVLTDTLPADLNYVSCQIDAPYTGTCSETGGVVTFNIDQTVLAGESGSVQLSVTIDPLASFPFTNTVRADYTDSWEVGSYNTTTTETTFSVLPLSVVKTPDVTEAPVGGVINYTYDVTNISPEPVILNQLVDDKIGMFSFPDQFPDAVALYDFSQGPDPLVIRDRSGFLTAQDLTIEDPSPVTYELDPERIDISGAATRISGDSSSTAKIAGECQAEGRLAVEAWVQAPGAFQSGPARIMTLSDGGNNDVFFSLYQDNDQFGFEISTTGGTTGTLTTGAASVSTDLTHLLAVVEESGAVTLYQDGIAVDTASLGATGGFSDWSTNYRFGFGNQLSTAVLPTDTTQDWQGKYYKAAVYCDTVRAEDALSLFELGSETDASGNRLLAPGETVTINASYTVQASDFPGSVINVAEVSGTTGDGEDFIVSDTAAVPVVMGPLSLVKTSSANAEVTPGETITYTLTLTNNDIVRHTGIRILDPLPLGTSYIANSTVVEGFRSVAVEYCDDFTTQSYGNTNNGSQPLCASTWGAGSPGGLGGDSWTEEERNGGPPFTVTTNGPTAGDVFIAGGELNFDRPDSDDGIEDFDALIREVNLAGLDSATVTFDFDFDGNTEACTPGTNGEDFGNVDDCLWVDVSNDGGSSYVELDTTPGGTLPVGGDPDNNNGTITVPIPAAFLTSSTLVRFRAAGFRGTESVSIDNVRIEGATTGPVTLDNDGVGTNELDDGDPANLVTTLDNLVLDPGQTMTVTFDVQVNDPLDSNILAIRNLASADSDQSVPTVAEVLDPVRPFGGQIGDSVWLDADGDGIFDLGEAGLPNVTVELVGPGPDGIFGNGDDVVLDSQQTDLNGGYLFANLPTGSYQTRVGVSTLPAGLQAGPASSNPAGPFLVTGTEQFLNADFGYVPQAGTAVVGDQVFSDADGDGIQDPGEPGIAGVTLELRNADTGAVIATTTTGPDGSYLFTGVPPGTYTVAVTDTGGALAGYSSTTGGNLSLPFTVNAGDTLTEVDFGYNNPFLATITDSIWFDPDGNGLRESTEEGIAGITVNLVDSSGNVVATTVTDPDGNITFSGVPDGDYQIVLSDLLGNLSGRGGTTTAARNRVTSVTVAGFDVDNDSFGFNQPGLIGDEVFSDANGNGVRDPGESLIPGVDVSLFRDNGDFVFDSTVDTPVNNAQTDGGGIYGFRGLPFGTYFTSLDPAQPALAGAVLTTGDSQGGANASGAQIDVVLSGGNGGVLTADYGFQNSALADISGNVFEDLDRDGVDDGAGEGGFPGVTIELYAAGPDGILGTADDLLIATAITDANGDYQFPDVPDGDFRVEVTDRDNVLGDYRLTSGLDNINVSVSAGNDITDLDFGYAPFRGSASLGDFVWLDADGDGVQEAGEPGIGGVTLQLFDAGPDGLAGTGDDLLFDTTVTDQLGNFDFKNLPAGRYFVDVADASVPAGLSLTTGLTDPSAVIALGAGDNVDTVDFGYRPDTATALIGDRVWIDADGDGVEDPGEAGLAGVTINLVGAGADGQLGTGDDLEVGAVTDGNGNYAFTGLPADDYFVTVDVSTLPAGFNTAPTNALETYQLTALSDTAYVLLDWGFQPLSPLGSIGDTVFLDSDGDGTQDAGEGGIGGVTVDLVEPGVDGVFGTADDVVSASAVTDGNGQYDFTGLGPGDYQVRLSDTGGVLSGLNPTATAPGTISLASGQDFNGADFGFSPASDQGSIGDQVFHDVNGNGVRETGESGIEGVTVELWLDVNNDNIITPGIDNLIRTETTDVNGEYEFGGVAQEDYLVRLAPADFGAGSVLEGTVPTAGTPGLNDNAQPSPLPLSITPANQNPLYADFGVTAPAAISLAGTVFEDISNDGVDNPGEPDVGGVAVVLYRDLDGDGLLDPDDPVFGMTVTDAGGDYLFDNLPPGDYILGTDATGSRLEGYFQTTQALTLGVQPAGSSVAGTAVTELDFGFYNGGVTTTPVTLAYFRAEVSGGGLSLRWGTATETGNVGFFIYGADGTGMRRLHSLVPSRVVDSTEWQQYSLELPGILNDQLWLSDIDIKGNETLHGPFELGRLYGDDRPPATIDWSSIRDSLERTQLEEVPLGLPGSADAVNLSVNQRGVVRVSYEQLESAGLPVNGASVDQLAVTLAGKPIPLRLSGNSFGPGEFIEFIGQPRDSLYSSDNVYRVLLDPGMAARMDTLESLATTPDAEASQTRGLVMDDNRQYSFASPNGDPWFLEDLFSFGGPDQAEFALDLSDRSSGGATLTVELWGVTDLAENPDHHVEVLVNGTQVAELFLDGLTPANIEASVAEGLLLDGDNTVTVRLPGDTGALFDLVNVESVALSYTTDLTIDGAGELDVNTAGDWRAEAPTPSPDTLFRATFEDLPDASFVVSGLTSSDVVAYAITETGPVWLPDATTSPDGAGYDLQVPGGLDARSYVISQADALVPVQPTPVVFDQSLDTESADYLVITHPAFTNGLSPLVDHHTRNGLSVKVVNVNDLYQRYGHGMVDPLAIKRYITVAAGHLGARFVLLVGGDSYDYQDYLGLGSLSFIPSVYGQVHEVVRYAPLDAVLADYTGDMVPDVAIGRFPVRTLQELDWMISKTLQYATKEYDLTAVFAADKAEPLTPFSAISDDIATELLQGWEITSAYLDEITPAQAQQQILSGIEAGAALTNYFGHSGFTEWGRTDRLLTSNDIDTLSNAGLPTVVNQWGCWNTYYVSPQADTLSHRFLVGGDYGAAAVLGPVSLTRLSSEQLQSNLSLPLVLTPGVTLGEAILQAKQTMAAAHPGREDVILGYALLGDPALVIQP